MYSDLVSSDGSIFLWLESRKDLLHVRNLALDISSRWPSPTFAVERPGSTIRSKSRCNLFKAAPGVGYRQFSSQTRTAVPTRACRTCTAAPTREHPILLRPRLYTYARSTGADTPPSRNSMGRTLGAAVQDVRAPRSRAGIF